MAEWISLTEMARRRGCKGHGAVQAAIRAGRIPESCVRRTASGRIKAVEYVAANDAWNLNTDIDQAARTPGGAATVAGAAAGELPLSGEPKASPPAQAQTAETSAIRVASAA